MRWSSPTAIAPGYPTIHMGSGPGRGRGRLAYPGKLVGSCFRLLRLLGQGGIGQVWDAEHVRLGRRVAIKLLRSDLDYDPVGFERFVREGRLAAALRHPHIVAVEEVGRVDGSPFMVMERLVGPSLDDVVMNEGALPWTRVRPLMLQICEALEHAHRARIVHHDVKPSNIVLASHPGHPEECKLVDFGIARRNLLEGHEVDVQLTIEGQILGSPGYISPEQMKGKRTNHRSDIYGLGCTIFHLLTGRPPIEVDTLPGLLQATLFSPPPPLPHIEGSPTLRRELEAVIHRALRKDPSDRFVSALHMAQAIAGLEHR